MKKSKLPKIDSIQKLAEFWGTHDLTDFEEELEEGYHSESGGYLVVGLGAFEPGRKIVAASKPRLYSKVAVIFYDSSFLGSGPPHF